MDDSRSARARGQSSWRRQAPPAPGQPPRVALVYARSTGDVDAISHYCDELVAALSRSGRVRAERVDVPGSGSAAGWKAALAGAPAYDAYLMQYNPYAYGRRGVAPWLPLAWSRLGGRARRAVNVHEAYEATPASTKVHTLTMLHRRQLHWLARGSGAMIATSRAVSEQIRHVTGSTPAEVPIGSTIGEVADPAEVRRVRERHTGPRGDGLIVACFGKNHPAHARGHVAEAVSAIARTRADFVVLNLGSDAPPLPRGVVEVRPGFLSNGSLLAHVAAADLVLVPYERGAATNRSTLMSALATGRPVLTTCSESTDASLLSGGMRIVPVSALDQYVQAAVDLTQSRDLRQVLGAAASALYGAHFAWDRVAGRTLDVLGMGDVGLSP